MIEASITLARNCGPGVIPGTLLDEFGPDDWLKANFGQDYQSRYFDAASTSKRIAASFTPPAVDLGIPYKSFKIDKDWQDQYHTNNLICFVGNVDAQFEWMVQTYAVPDRFIGWDWDFDLVMRYLPLLAPQDGGVFFYPRNFAQLMRHLFQNEQLAMLLFRPTGPLADEF